MGLDREQRRRRPSNCRIAGSEAVNRQYRCQTERCSIREMRQRASIMAPGALWEEHRGKFWQDGL